MWQGVHGLLRRRQCVSASAPFPCDILPCPNPTQRSGASSVPGIALGCVPARLKEGCPLVARRRSPKRMRSECHTAGVRAVAWGRQREHWETSGVKKISSTVVCVPLRAALDSVSFQFAVRRSDAARIAYARMFMERSAFGSRRFERPTNPPCASNGVEFGVAGARFRIVGHQRRPPPRYTS